MNNFIDEKVIKSLTAHNYFVLNLLSPKNTWNDSLVTNLSRANYIHGIACFYVSL